MKSRSIFLVVFLGALWGFAAVPASKAAATGDDANRRAEAQVRQGFLTRAFDETRRTMRYACEAPTQLEARLCAYAGALQAAPR